MATVGTITGTTLGTSSPLNLTRGFGFFPANTTIDNPSPPTIIGIGDAEGLSHTLLDIQNGIPIAEHIRRGRCAQVFHTAGMDQALCAARSGHKHAEVHDVGDNAFQ